MGLLFYSGAAYCSKIEEITFANVVNPHGKVEQCSPCHGNAKVPNRSNYNVESCFDCHSLVAHNRRIHITKFEVPESRNDRKVEFPVSKGRSDCRSCHVFDCQSESSNIPVALRGAPYGNPVHFCLNCHRESVYERFYPHGAEIPLPERLTAEFSTLQDPLDAELLRCSVCHTDVKSAFGFLDIRVGALVAPLSRLCFKCHFDRGHQNKHMGTSLFRSTMREDAPARLRAFIQKNQVWIPLEDKQKITCVTCHSPHARCTKGAPLATPSPGEKLLRLPKEQLCEACHDL